VQGIGGFGVDHMQEYALHVLRDFYRYAANLVEVSNPAGAVRGLAVDHDLSVYLPHFAKKAACRLLA